MAQTDIQYGWTPDATTAKQDGSSSGLQRSYPSWLNSYGYTGSLSAPSDPNIVGNSTEDPFMKQIRDAMAASAAAAAKPTTGDTTARTQAGGGVAGAFQQGGEANVGGAAQGGGDLGGALGLVNGDALQGAGTAFQGLGSSIYDGLTSGQIGQTLNNIGAGIADAFGGGGPPAGAANDVAQAAGPGNGSDQQFFRGGLVTQNRLTGPNPPGPDDGYASLNKGEGVLTAAALKHYGPGIVNKLNKLAVPKGAFGR